MNKETLKHIITDFHERILPDTKPRELQLPLETSKIITLVGIRRCGKTFLLFSTIKRLIRNGIDPVSILYLNFEDDRLFPITTSDLDLILKAYHELYPEKVTEKKYLFFDEVQNIPLWEKYIRRIYDTETLQIYITGSSSQLTSREIATSLRGRCISFEVFPLSFSEYLSFKNIQVRQYSKKSEAELANAFDNYLNWGGFPEVVLENEDIRNKILEEYSDLLFYKDLVEQYGLKNMHLLKYLLKYCFTNPGTLMSINKLYNDLKSQQITLSKNTLYEYFEYLHESFIIFVIPNYAKSIRKQTHSPKKVYSIDNGLMNVFLPRQMIDRSKKLENTIFHHLRRKSPSIFYYHNKQEVDFVLDNESQLSFFNVSYSIRENQTARREIGGLKIVQAQFPECSTALILKEWDSKLFPDDVNVFPVWQFLLEN